MHRIAHDINLVPNVEVSFLLPLCFVTGQDVVLLFILKHGTWRVQVLIALCLSRYSYLLYPLHRVKICFEKTALCTVRIAASFQEVPTLEDGLILRYRYTEDTIIICTAG